jgi:hypothetical protein
MAATLKTTEEIQAELVRLRDLQNRVRRWNLFGEDNRAAIGVQIQVLDKRMSLDGIDAEWNSAMEYGDTPLHNAAVEAHDWYMGLSDEPAPSEGWQVLA